MLNDNRINPRVRADFSASIMLAEQPSLNVAISNISLTGIQIDGSQADFRAILGERHSIFSAQQTDPREMDVKFSIPGGPGLGRAAKIEARCRAIHVRRTSQNSYQIGLKFIDLNAKAETRIAKFVACSLAARARPAKSA